jgi:hypothetical protein
MGGEGDNSFVADHPSTLDVQLSIPMRKLIVLLVGIGFAAIIWSCGGSSDICNCTPTAPASVDFRHDQKHVPLPGGVPQEITVATILSWPQFPIPANDAPRTGRELQLFHVSQAFVQLAWQVPSDCDLHMEISATADKSAPRVIVETPVDSEYCFSRRSFVSALNAHGISLARSLQTAELPVAIPAQVTGLAFHDFNHPRGSAAVQTVWELHPAVVTLGQ